MKTHGSDGRCHAARRRVGDRPWRSLGAAICGLATVMFILGVCFLDESRGRAGYMLYWFVILGLLFWLCLLAFKDLRHTRRQAAAARSALMDELGERTAAAGSEVTPACPPDEPTDRGRAGDRTPPDREMTTDSSERKFP